MKEQEEGVSYRNFTEEEKSMIEQELNKKMYADVPNEIEICMMARELQEKIGAISSLDLLAYLQRKFAKVENSVKSSGINPRPQHGAIFRQFAQIKTENQPRQIMQEEPKIYICRSKRKIRPAQSIQRRNLEELVEYMDNNTNDCHILLEKKSRKGNPVRQNIGQLQQNCSWAYNQYFYSVFDKGFLKDQENFKRILEQIPLIPESTTYYDHKALRIALPKPNLFNNEFVVGQLQRLSISRNQARVPKQQRGRGELQLSVSRQVIAVHPICGHLHAGNILAIYKQNQYMVKFSRPELGTRRIIDTNIALKQITHPHKVITDNVNYEAMSLTIKLLQYKADLIKTLQRYNDIAQQAQRQKTQLGNIFFQQYGWVGSTINILSLGLKHILSKFRVRGLDLINQEKIGKNFQSVLLNPLNLMDKQLQKSPQNSDINASQQIKRIISGFKQSKVQQYTKQLFSRYWSNLKTADWSQQQRYEYQLLLKSLVGVLASLKIENKHFSIEQNKYFKDLMGHFDNGYSEYFNQIYELLTSIVNKLIDEK